MQKHDKRELQVVTTLKGPLLHCTAEGHALRAEQVPSIICTLIA